MVDTKKKINFESFKALTEFMKKPPKKEKSYHLLWDSSIKGTYVKSKHGELK